MSVEIGGLDGVVRVGCEDGNCVGGAGGLDGVVTCDDCCCRGGAGGVDCVVGVDCEGCVMGDECDVCDCSGCVDR